MRIVADEKKIDRNVKIGQYTMTGGLVLLLGALVLNVLLLNQPPNFWTLGGLFAALMVGIVLTSVSNYFNYRWGPRFDKRLTDALKTLDDTYTFYHYELGAAHVLSGPTGLYVILPKNQEGPVQYDAAKKRWFHVGARRGLFGSNPNPLGEPDTDVVQEAKQLEKHLAKRAPDLKDLTMIPLVVFTNTQAVLEVEGAPVTVLHIKQFKDWLRKRPKDATNSGGRLNAALSVEA